MPIFYSLIIIIFLKFNNFIHYSFYWYSGNFFFVVHFFVVVYFQLDFWAKEKGYQNIFLSQTSGIPRAVFGVVRRHSPLFIGRSPINLITTF